MDKIEKIDLDNLGVVITSYIDGKPSVSHIDGIEACKQLAVKINELIDITNHAKD